MSIDYASLETGQTVAELTLPPLDRTTLALFAGASGDHNPIHIDIDFARRAGMPDVFGHGMLSMAYLGRVLTKWVSQDHVREFNARFVGITQLGNELQCTACVAEKFERDGEQFVRVELNCENQFGEPKILGEALVVI